MFGEYDRLNVGSDGPKYTAVSVPVHVPIFAVPTGGAYDFGAMANTAPTG